MNLVVDVVFDYTQEMLMLKWWVTLFFFSKRSTTDIWAITKKNG